jgi:hypothetical protein
MTIAEYPENSLQTLIDLYAEVYGLTDPCHIMDSLHAAGMLNEAGLFEDTVRVATGKGRPVALPLDGREVPRRERQVKSTVAHSGKVHEGPARRQGSQWGTKAATPAPKPETPTVTTVTYRKHQDVWALQVTGPVPAEGTEVTVAKRDGTTKVETAGAVLARFAEATIVAIAKTARSTGTPAAPTVPAGHYATPSRTGNNDLDFWAVDVPTDGKWAGYTFVSRVIGGHEDTRVRGAEARQALDAIAAFGPQDAAKAYGRAIGRCGRCNRHLTDETSRTLGLGPECAQKGW